METLNNMFLSLAEYYLALSENLENSSYFTIEDWARLHNVTVYHKARHIQERFSGDGRANVCVTNIDPYCLA